MGIARASLTLHRKAKDGSDGKNGKDALSFTVTPSSVAVKCKADGTLEQDTYTCSVAVMRGTTNITSSYKPKFSSYSYVTPTLNTAGTILTLSGFSASKNEGFVNMYVDVDGTTLKQKVTFYKVFDGAKGDKGDKGDPGTQGEQGEKGEKGDKGENGHSYAIQCPSVTIYVDSAGVMKSATKKQRVQAKLYIDGEQVTSGVTWSVTANTGITATINTDGWVELSNLVKGTTITSFTVTAKKSGMPADQKLTVQVGVSQDGQKGLQGVAGDTMLCQGEYDSTKTYQRHYQLDNTSDQYFTDYVSYGKNGSMAQFWAVAADEVTGVTPSETATQWIKFSTAEYMATKLLVSNQILSNIIEAVNISATKFYTQTLKAKTIDAENATFKNLTVSGYFRSGFEIVRYDYEDTMMGTGKGVYLVQDKLNLMVEKQSNDTKSELIMWLPNDEKFVGARVLVFVAPEYNDYGTGLFYRKHLDVLIRTGCFVPQRTGLPPTFVDRASEKELTWFLNTDCGLDDPNVSSTLYAPARTIKVFAGFIELIGVPYVVTSGNTTTTYCRWMLLSVQSPTDVEYYKT